MPRRRPADHGPLFDLPLEPPAATRSPAEPAGEELGPLEEPEGEELEQLPLLEAEPSEEPSFAGLDSGVDEDLQAEPVETAAPPRAEAADPRRATLGLRLAAGLADLGVCVAVLLFLLVALLAQEVQPRLSDWPAALLFLLAFSFLYSVLPLAFWGRTPGMSLAGLRSSSADGRPLTFRQAVLGWLGGVLTVALAGLPLLLALGGRSLSDLISGSLTRRLDGTA